MEANITDRNDRKSVFQNKTPCPDNYKQTIFLSSVLFHSPFPPFLTSLGVLSFSAPFSFLLFHLFFFILFPCSSFLLPSPSLLPSLVRIKTRQGRDVPSFTKPTILCCLTSTSAGSLSSIRHGLNICRWTLCRASRRCCSATRGDLFQFVEKKQQDERQALTTRGHNYPVCFKAGVVLFKPPQGWQGEKKGSFYCHVRFVSIEMQLCIKHLLLECRKQRHASHNDPSLPAN